MSNVDTISIQCCQPDSRPWIILCTTGQKSVVVTIPERRESDLGKQKLENVERTPRKCVKSRTRWYSAEASSLNERK